MWLTENKNLRTRKRYINIEKWDRALKPSLERVKRKSQRSLRWSRKINRSSKWPSIKIQAWNIPIRGQPFKTREREWSFEVEKFWTIRLDHIAYYKSRNCRHWIKNNEIRNPKTTLNLRESKIGYISWSGKWGS